MCAVRPGRGVGVVARVPRAREALVPVKRARCLRRHRGRPRSTAGCSGAREGADKQWRERGRPIPRRTGVRPPRESSQPRARLALAPAHMHGMWPGTVCVHASAAHVHCAISSAPCHRPAEVLTASHRHRSAAALWRLLSAQPRSEAAQSNFDSPACQLCQSLKTGHLTRKLSGPAVL